MSPLVIYGSITIICGLFLFLMAVLGSDYDVDADVDIDAGVEGMEVGEAGGPGIFSLKLILIFMIGFGISGFTSAYLKWPVHHTIPGLIGGLVIWFLSYKALSWLYRQQSTSQVRGASFVGREAKVTVPIPKGGTGEVYSQIKGTEKSIYFNARATNPQREYGKGEVVTIKSVEGKTATVE
jgi:membrane protein implicated in regulation of membrane protease activity